MTPLSAFTKSPSVNSAWGLVGKFLPPEISALCRRVCRGWKNAFDNNEALWTFYMAKDYPHITIQPSESSKCLYFKIRKVSYHCLKYEVKESEKSKFTPERSYNFLLHGYHFVHTCFSSTYYVMTCKTAINVYTSNFSKESFSFKSQLNWTIPEIYHDRYLLLANPGQAYELWDLQNKEKICEGNETLHLHDLRSDGKYLFYAKENSLIFIPLGKGITRIPPLIVETSQKIENAHKDKNQRIIFDTSFCYITDLGGNIIKSISVEFNHRVEWSAPITFYENESFYCIGSKAENYFQLIFKNGESIKKVKSINTPCFIHNERIYYFIESKLYFHCIKELSESWIHSLSPVLYFDFDNSKLRIEGVFGNLIIFRDDIKESHCNFVLFNLNTKNVSSMSHNLYINNKIELHEGLILFINWNVSETDSCTLINIIDARSGRKLTEIFYKGRFAGINDKSEMVFFDDRNNSSIKFKTHHLETPVREKIDNVEQCFELM